MFLLIKENLATIIVVLVIAAAITAAVVKIIRDKRNPKSSCGGGCKGCMMRGSCHKEDE